MADRQLHRVAAAALAASLTVGLQSVLNEQHPPAAPPAMFGTLDGLKSNWSTVSVVTIRLLLAAAFGVIVQICQPIVFQ